LEEKSKDMKEKLKLVLEKTTLDDRVIATQRTEIKKLKVNRNLII
jgi:hypothetical protein